MGSPSTLRAFVDEIGAETEGLDRTLVVVNRTEPEPIRRMLDSLFDGQPVSVREETIDDVAADTVLLLEDGEPVASSPLDALERSILLVNSDLYITGAGSVETVDPPDVIAALRDTPFRVRGYPASNSEKLPMILLSRSVERLACDAGTGRLRAAFQRLSRIRDEHGTRSVYERLADTDVDVHVYGLPDCELPGTLDVTVHGGDSAEYRRCWFVVYVPTEPGVEAAALVAEEVAPNEWYGAWTFDRDRVDRIDRYVERSL